MQQLPDPSNQYFEMAAQFVFHTSKNLFLTGRAGSGKTTFLHYIKEHCLKKMAVLAPTGVAAINAGGSTLHSFFQLPFGSFIPGHYPVPESPSSQFYSRQNLLRQLRLSKPKRTLIRELELLIIDEVSMVRADLLDAVDAVLRHVRKQPELPFGGVQMLFIGDLSQLPPVVNEQEWKTLVNFYASPFFFHARCLQEQPPLYLELKKIYRQSDETFIRILNNIRHNKVKAEDLQILEQYYRPGFVPEDKEEYITLTTHNRKADVINQEELKKLKGRLHTFEARTEGEFQEKSYPAEKQLQLKEGAQVMFIKNDKGEQRRYYNGKIGTVKKIRGSDIYISFPGEKGEFVLEKETWRNVRYHYNQEEDRIEEEETGTFTQYPVRLAWAITIHKSQGLTFRKAIIDAGASFAPGQVYVAISRLTSLGGLILYSRILPQSISTDEQAYAFSKSELQAEELGTRLQEAQKQYIHSLLFQAFDFEKPVSMLIQFLEELDSRKIPNQKQAEMIVRELVGKIQAQKTVADKFLKQLEQMIHQAETTGYSFVHERTEAASGYFEVVMEKDLIHPLQQHYDEIKKKGKAKKYRKDLEIILISLSGKKERLRQVKEFTSGLQEGTPPAELLKQNEAGKKEKLNQASSTVKGEPKTKSEKAVKGETKLISLAMFREGKSIEEIAAERGFVPGTIEGHLASFIPRGEVRIEELVPEEKIKLIIQAIEAAGHEAGSAKLKEMLSEEISYGDIKAVLADLERQKNH